jgi:MFS superfamily sulfate permease-like transporter
MITSGLRISSADQHRPRVALLQGLLPLSKSRLLPDVIAGITLAALGIPEVMGYTKIIGTPVITGLYTLLLPVVAFAVFGSSRHLVVSADSATAAIPPTKALCRHLMETVWRRASDDWLYL